MPHFDNPLVAAAFDRYPPPVRRKMLALRALVFKTAARTPGVGELEETLKWGEPAYLTSQSRSGSTIRMDWKAKAPTEYALYFNCQTNLIDTFRSLFPTEFRYEGDRAIVLGVDDKLPVDSLAFCIAAALTHHRRKAETRA